MSALDEQLRRLIQKSQEQLHKDANNRMLSLCFEQMSDKNEAHLEQVLQAMAKDGWHRSTQIKTNDQRGLNLEILMEVRWHKRVYTAASNGTDVVPNLVEFSWQEFLRQFRIKYLQLKNGGRLKNESKLLSKGQS